MKFFRTMLLFAIGLGLLAAAGYVFPFDPMALPVAAAGASSLLMALA